MEYRQLGSSGVQVPEVGLGMWQYRGGVEPLRRGIELGATLLDTAEIYRTEDVAGQAIQGLRDRVFVATKVSGDHLKYDQVLKAADASLKRLGVSTIDLYQVHWPDDGVPIAETMRALEELVDGGKVRFIGVSNFSVAECQRAQAALKRNRIVSNQVEYSLLRRAIEPDIARYYEPNGVTVMAYSPLARGELVSTKQRRGLQVLQAIAQELGRTPAQVALNWCLSRPAVITIPKSDRIDRVEENCAASGWSLTPEHVTALDEAFS